MFSSCEHTDNESICSYTNSPENRDATTEEETIQVAENDVEVAEEARESSDSEVIPVDMDIPCGQVIPSQDHGPESQAVMNDLIMVKKKFAFKAEFIEEGHTKEEEDNRRNNKGTGSKRRHAEHFGFDHSDVDGRFYTDSGECHEARYGISSKAFAVNKSLKKCRIDAFYTRKRIQSCN